MIDDSDPLVSSPILFLVLANLALTFYACLFLWHSPNSLPTSSIKAKEKQTDLSLFSYLILVFAWVWLYTDQLFIATMACVLAHLVAYTLFSSQYYWAKKKDKTIGPLIFNLAQIPLKILSLLYYPLTWLCKPLKIGRNGLLFADLNYVLSMDDPEPQEKSELDPEMLLLQNALDFRNALVKDCMKPRNEIVSVDIQLGMESLRKQFQETHFSKILIYEKDQDNILGYVHSFDLFRNPDNIRDILHPIPLVPETLGAEDLFKRFVREKRSLAIVIDEFGGLSGLVSLEDLLEEIFGEIEDEHDVIEYTEEKIADNTFLLSGRLEIDYLNDKYGFGLPESEHYDTLAGFVLDLLGEIPQSEACVSSGPFEITVSQVNGNKIELITLHIKD